LKDLFLEASDSSDVVLACRVSPKQKADIVEMIRKRFKNKKTLAIGDGANDVNMIQKAHVGVGIYGKEGQQAARSADYAIGQFKFLKPLMFIHGRESYRRNSLLVAYTFYKNILYVIP
jgi:phospholipid-transporting ATPase